LALPKKRKRKFAVLVLISPAREINFSARVQRETGPCRLWELIRADIAEAEFIEAAVSQRVKSIHQWL
jgi:hypothetical protein